MKVKIGIKMKKCELKKILSDLALPNKAEQIVKPDRKSISKLYATIRDATIDEETGELTYSSKFPWNEKHAETLRALRFFLPENRSEPLTNCWSSDWLDYFASFLSSEKVRFIERIAAPRLIKDYIHEYSFPLARNFVSENPEYSIQYGWLLHRCAMWIFATFHAVVKSPSGDLTMLHETPGAPFERTVAFVPDNKNKLDFKNNSSPALVGLNLFHSSEFQIGTRDRILTRNGISYISSRAIPVDVKSNIVRTGQCPHQPSETMDYLGDIPYEIIRERLKVGA